VDWSPNRCSCDFGAPADPLFEVADINFRAVPATGIMVRCPLCGSLFPDRFPMPDSVEAAYDGYYIASAGGRRRGPRRWIGRLMDRSRRDYLTRDLPPYARRVLDFGCGSGAFLIAIEAARPDLALFGTDLGPRPGVGAFRWLAPEAIAEGAPYDWITLGHVLEHHADPRALLNQLAGSLGPGGGLWIATPNAESFLIETAGPWARDIDFPRHREIFTRAGLTRLLEACGLEPSFRSPPRVNAILNTLTTLKNLRIGEAANRGTRARRAVASLFALALHMLSPAAARAGKSPELVLICRKRGDGGPLDAR